MLKKLQKPNNSSLECVDLVLSGAKKRRKLAVIAINSMNAELTNTPKFTVIK